MAKKLGKFVIAVLIYAAFAVYLYRPHFKGFDVLQLRDLFVVNVCIAAAGCFVLSRRWVSSFWGSFFAGAIYGFGPYMLGLAKFHPAAGLLAAVVPWLFCPAALGFKGKWRVLSWLFSALPFLAILLFFQVAAHFRLFAIPTQLRPESADLLGLLTPLVSAEKSSNLLGFYHIPIAALVMGLSLLFAARRFGVMIILILPVVLAFCGSFLNVSPFIWLAITALCCSILIGAGLQGLASAGYADRKWPLIIFIIMIALVVVTLLLATEYFKVFAGLGAKYGELFLQAARMYILGAITAAIIFFMARARLRAVYLRWTILASAMTVDIFTIAAELIDKIL